MIPALFLQLAFVLAALAALFVMINTKDTGRRLAAQPLFGIFLAGSILTQALSFQEGARARVVERVSDLERLATAEVPSETKREGLDLMTSGIESALEVGLGRGNMALLIGGGILLGMGLAQLLALHRSKEPSRTFRQEAEE